MRKYRVGEMSKRLEEYPDLMTKEEVAELLRLQPSMVHRIGLKKTRIGNGRGKILYRKQDVKEYIESRVDREEVRKGVNKDMMGLFE